MVGLAACLLFVAAEDADKGKKGEHPLDGVWKAASVVFSGNDVEDMKGLKFTFKGDKLTRQTPGGEDEAYTFKLDPSKTPHEVDFVPEQGENKGKTLKGIYAVKEGEMKMALSLSPEGKRPAEFVSKDGEEVALVVLKKDKS
jgi:uncharacterized protein (TIGR03067 family)